jgi:MFS family permease
MITAKLSDVWGLKTVLLACAVIFLVFSIACGVAQTMTQLYVDVWKLSAEPQLTL